METPEKLAAQNRLVAADPVVAAMLDSHPEPAVLLNRCRQIVLANDKIAKRLQRSRESLIGNLLRRTWRRRQVDTRQGHV